MKVYIDEVCLRYDGISAEMDIKVLKENGKLVEYMNYTDSEGYTVKECYDVMIQDLVNEIQSEGLIIKNLERVMDNENI